MLAVLLLLLLSFSFPQAYGLGHWGGSNVAPEIYVLVTQTSLAVSQLVRPPTESLLFYDLITHIYSVIIPLILIIIQDTEIYLQFYPRYLTVCLLHFFT